MEDKQFSWLRIWEGFLIRVFQAIFVVLIGWLLKEGFESKLIAAANEKIAHYAEFDARFEILKTNNQHLTAVASHFSDSQEAASLSLSEIEQISVDHTLYGNDLISAIVALTENVDYQTQFYSDYFDEFTACLKRLADLERSGYESVKKVEQITARVKEVAHGQDEWVMNILELNDPPPTPAPAP